jgi:hypothetical protein
VRIGLTDQQREIVLAEVDATLNGRAKDLKYLSKHPDPDRSVAEVAALARLSADLNVYTLDLPDPEAQKASAQLLIEVEDHIEHEDVRPTHEAMQAFARRRAALLCAPRGCSTASLRSASRSQGNKGRGCPMSECRNSEPSFDSSASSDPIRGTSSMDWPGT